MHSTSNYPRATTYRTDLEIYYANRRRRASLYAWYRVSRRTEKKKTILLNSSAHKSRGQINNVSGVGGYRAWNTERYIIINLIVRAHYNRHRYYKLL